MDTWYEEIKLALVEEENEELMMERAKIKRLAEIYKPFFDSYFQN